MSTGPETGYQKIAILENVIEAQVLGALLEEDGIPHRIGSFHDTAYDGLFQFQRGWGAVYGQPRHRKAITDLLQQIRDDRDAPGAAGPT